MAHCGLVHCAGATCETNHRAIRRHDQRALLERRENSSFNTVEKILKQYMKGVHACTNVHHNLGPITKHINNGDTASQSI